jgi:hypothetical protein
MHHLVYVLSTFVLTIWNHRMCAVLYFIETLVARELATETWHHTPGGTTTHLADEGGENVASVFQTGLCKVPVARKWASLVYHL